MCGEGAWTDSAPPHTHQSPVGGHCTLRTKGASPMAAPKSQEIRLHLIGRTPCVHGTVPSRVRTISSGHEGHLGGYSGRTWGGSRGSSALKPKQPPPRTSPSSVGPRGTRHRTNVGQKHHPTYRGSTIKNIRTIHF